MRPPTAFPVVANCAACAMVSPRTSRAGARPTVRASASTASAARPYGATSGFAIAKRLTPSSLEQTRQAVEPFVDRERRARGREEHEASDRVDHTRVAGQTRRRQLIRKLLVGRQEHLERRAVLDLSASACPMRRRRGRRACHDRARMSGDFGQREVEIALRPRSSADVEPLRPAVRTTTLRSGRRINVGTDAPSRSSSPIFLSPREPRRRKRDHDLG